MASILLADDGIEFDGRTPEERPLGGVESSVVALTAELARRGHRVMVRNKCREPLDYNGIEWRPIDGEPWPETVDLYIANRGDKLIPLMPGAGRTVFWIHNPARYLMKWRYLWKLWRYRPPIVFIGDYHATTYPDWAPGGERVVIPYGMSDIFCQSGVRKDPPGPRAVFTSNPLRSLDWLLRLWSKRIEPAVPGAELHLFTGAATYGRVGDGKSAAMEAILKQAKDLAGQGVRLRGPVAKTDLVDEFARARCILYRGDLNETFCLAVGEAQACGVPAVVQALGSVIERVVDGRTGYVMQDDDQFAERAVELLKDDDLWCRQHEAAIAEQRGWRWPNAAAAFEALLPTGAGS